MPSRVSNNNSFSPRGGGRRRKGGNQLNETGVGSQQQHPPIDEQHNSDFPCSDHLRHIALEIIRGEGGFGVNGGASSSNVSSPSSLNHLIFEQILAVSQQQQQADGGDTPSTTTGAGAAGGGGSNKKKRKKKKKKKNKSKAPGEVTQSASVDDEEEGVGEQQLDSDSVAVAGPSPSSSCPKVSTFTAAEPAVGASEVDTVVVSPSSSSSVAVAASASASSQQTEVAVTITAPPSSPTQAEGQHHHPMEQQTVMVDNPHSAFLHEFLCNMNAASATSKPQSTTTTTTTTVSSNTFWSRILSQNCEIPMKRINSYTARINCGVCRASVESILEYETELVLKSIIPTKLQLPSSSDNNEHAFDYVAMEEGNGPVFIVDDAKEAKTTTPDDALVFALTTASAATTDKSNRNNKSTATATSNNKAWQLRFHNNTNANNEEEQDDGEGEQLSQQILTHHILLNYILGHGLSYEDMLVATREITPAQHQLPSSASSSTSIKNDDVEKDDMNPNSNLGPQMNHADARSLQRKVNKAYDEKGVYYAKNCMQKLLKSTQTFNQITDENDDAPNDDAADITTFSCLHEVSADCTKIIVDRLFDSVVWETTMMFITCSSPSNIIFEKRGKQTLLEKVWINYLNVLSTVTNAITKYELELEKKVALPNGKIPAFFWSSTSRQLYKEVVRTKVFCAAKLIERLETAMSTPIETGWPAFEIGGTTSSNNMEVNSINGAGTGAVCIGGKGGSSRTNHPSSSPFFTTFQKRLLTQQAYYEKQREGTGRKETSPAVHDTDLHHHNSNNNEQDQEDHRKPSFKVLPQDAAAVLDYMKAINEQFDTVNRGSIHQVKEERRLRNERISRRLKNVLEKFDSMVNEIITTATASSSSPLVDGLAKLHKITATTNLAAAAAVPSSGDTNTNGDHDNGAALPPTTSISQLTIHLIQYWIDLRCQYKAVIIVDEPKAILSSPFLPTNLIKRMAVNPTAKTINNYQEMGQQLLDDDDEDCQHGHHYCSPEENAKERAIAICICCYYQWMVEKYDEWRAEMAEQELLTNLLELEEKDSTTLSTNNKGGATAMVDNTNGSKGKQGNKKSKKKKNKGLNVSPKNGSTTTTESVVSTTSAGKQEEATSPAEGETKNKDRNTTDNAEEDDATATTAGAPGSTGDTAPTEEHRPPSPKRVGANNNKKGTNTATSDQQNESISAGVSSTGGNKLLPPPGLQLKRDEAIPSKSEEEEENDDGVIEIDSFVAIGVYDLQNNFFPAEEFLSARLVAVLNENGSWK